MRETDRVSGIEVELVEPAEWLECAVAGHRPDGDAFIEGDVFVPVAVFCRCGSVQWRPEDRRA